MVNISSLGKIDAKEVFSGKSIDGAYFKKIKKPENVFYQIDFIKFNDEVQKDHSQDIGADNWIVMLFEEIEDEKYNYDVVYFHSYILDPFNFMNNQIKADSQGILIKRSMPGYKIIQTLIKELELDDIKEQIENDIMRFHKLYN